MTRRSCMETTGRRAVAVAVEQAKRLKVEDVEPATPGLEPRQKLEEAATKRLENVQFLELEWLQSASAESK